MWGGGDSTIKLPNKPIILLISNDMKGNNCKHSIVLVGEKHK